MSTLSNPVRSRWSLPTRLPRPRLTIVPKVASRAPRVPFVILVVLVLGGGLIGLLLLNTTLQRGAYEATDLRSQAAALQVQEQALQMQVADLRQPHRVAEAALALGMVRNDSPAFLDLATGRVMGSATAATEENVPVLGMTPQGTGGVATEKEVPTAAGAGASRIDDFVTVPKQRDPKSGADTRTRSTEQQGSRVTNNTSNSRQQ